MVLAERSGIPVVRDPAEMSGQPVDSPGSVRPTAERRWPMAAAVLVTVVLQIVTPQKGRLVGWWVYPSLELILLVLLIARDPGRIDRPIPGLRRMTLALIAIMTVGVTSSVLVLMYDILAGVTGITATDLLGRGASVYVSNVIVFSLWYSELDRGGPAQRAAGSPVRASFAFPENATPELAPPGWLPRYPDYLYLSYTNSTAFSPTDTLPLRTWNKMTMMVQSSLQLATAILVIARAINVLPG